jgi:hypothetical protein
LPSNSKECDRRPPLQKMVWKIDYRMVKLR